MAFDTVTGQQLKRDDVLDAMETADIVLIGEIHTDAAGHALQTKLLEAAILRWPTLVLSLEEFDRSQQPLLDAYAAGEISTEALLEQRIFVSPRVRENWRRWYLPKLQVAIAGEIDLLASNAPLRYSRLVRNLGCDDLPELDPLEAALFDCPVAPLDPDYKARFARILKSSTKGATAMKQLGSEQVDRMFRAQRVWDATMAQTIATSRAATGSRIVHLVGNVHIDFDGGLVQELRARDKEARILTISLRPARSQRLLPGDRDRAAIVVYTH